MMTDTPERCEPPEEWRTRPRHWLQDPRGVLEIASWSDTYGDQSGLCWQVQHAGMGCERLAELGYHYVAPVLTPAEITEREAAAYRRGQREMRNAAGNAVADCYFQECCGEPMQDGECCGIARIVFSPEAAQSLGETIAALPIKEKPE